MSSGQEPRAGEPVGRYVLESHLGSGGFASVWLARDPERRPVVIKLMRAEIAVESSARTRFAREVAVLTELDHPGIVKVVDHDLSASPPYFVMERVVGQALRDRLIEGSTMERPLPIATVVSVMRAMTDAVAYAHDSGVIHRDLKPANVLLDVADAPRVLDFGMARLMGADRHAATTLGRIMGTRYYWAPEQAQGEEATPATDQFCLATIAFEMLTLRRAWVRADGGVDAAPIHLQAPVDLNRPLAILERLRTGARPSAVRYRPGLSAAVDAVLARAWAVEQADRYSDVRAFEAALAEALEGASTQVLEPPEATRVLATRVSETKLTTPTRMPGTPARGSSAEAGMTSDHGAMISVVHATPSARGPLVVVALLLIVVGALAYVLSVEPEPPLAAEAPVPEAPAPVAIGATAAVPEEVVTATGAAERLETPAAPEPSPPVSRPRASDARAPRTKAARDPTPRPTTAAPAPARRGAALHARLDALAARPDLAQLAAFADQLEELAEAIPNAEARARVRRLVATGSAVGDVGRLRQALVELERAGTLE